MINLYISDLYCHRDFDGIVAAAMVSASLPLSPRIHTVQYSPGLSWLDQDIGNNAGIVDFLFHPTAQLWVDHHATTFGSKEGADIFHPDQYHVFEPEAPSCPNVIAKLPWFKSSAHWDEYIYWAAIIDSANYESPSQANDLNNPYLMISRVIGQLKIPEHFAALVDAIQRHPAMEILKFEPYAMIKNDILESELLIRRELLAHLKILGVVTLLDQSKLAIPYHRYLAYEVHPDTIYGIGLYQSAQGIIVSVGENPWRRAGRIDLGALCKQYGGGGRRTTAGVPVSTVNDAQQLAFELATKLNIMYSDQ